jgi:ribosome-binding protein aMBF1 (putative translation factor)
MQRIFYATIDVEEEEIMTNQSLFWQDLSRDMQNPDFRREYILQTQRIRTIDEIVNALDDARQTANLSKADLARAINAEPAVVRRLFSAHGNPTLGRLSEIAAALGLRVSLEPLDRTEAKFVTGSLLLKPAKKAGKARTVKRATRGRHHKVGV